MKMEEVLQLHLDRHRGEMTAQEIKEIEAMIAELKSQDGNEAVLVNEDKFDAQYDMVREGEDLPMYYQDKFRKKSKKR